MARVEVGSVAVHAKVVHFSLQVNSDLYIFGETVKDYIALLASIKVEDCPFSLSEEEEDLGRVF